MSETAIRLIVCVLIDDLMVTALVLFVRTLRQWKKLGDRANATLDSIDFTNASSALLEEIQSRPNCNDCAKGGGCGNGTCQYVHWDDTIVYGCPLWEGEKKDG